jgi:hypothetical protein
MALPKSALCDAVRTALFVPKCRTSLRGAAGRREVAAGVATFGVDTELTGLLGGAAAAWVISIGAGADASVFAVTAGQAGSTQPA